MPLPAVLSIKGQSASDRTVLSMYSVYHIFVCPKHSYSKQNIVFKFSFCNLYVQFVHFTYQPYEIFSNCSESYIVG